MNGAPPGLREDVPLAPKTTLGVGGSARWWVETADARATIDALAWADGARRSVVVLGGGSNVLVADRGLDAVVVRPVVRGRAVERDGDRVRVRVGAGEPWDAIVEWACAEGWAGLECMSGIPGDVGGTPIQNVGAYGQEVGETIVEVVAIDRKTRARVSLSNADCAFSYRDSAFKRAAKDRYVVVEVVMSLRAGGAASVRYPELARHLGVAEGGSPPPLADVRAAVLELRRRKSMVLDPADENRRSAGSFFTNPIVKADVADSVRARAAAFVNAGETMPSWPTGSSVKLSAAWLIERAGFVKGTARGNVGISTRHSLAIVNRGGATAAEIVAFAADVRRAVHDRFGVWLTPEPVALGLEPADRRALGADREANDDA